MGKILVVDDMPENRRMFSEILDTFGHSYETAGSIQEAISKCTTHSFDLVFMDITIPMEKGGDADPIGGIKATKTILSFPKMRDTPIIAVTAHGMEAQKKAILNSGIKSIVEKGTERFIESIEEVVAHYLNPVVKKELAKAIATGETVEDLLAVLAMDEDEVSVLNDAKNGSRSTSKKEEPKLSVRDSIETVVNSKLPAEDSDPRIVIASVLTKAAKKSGNLLVALQDLGRDKQQLSNAEKLSKILQDVANKIGQPNRIPIEGSSLQHWVVNLLILVPGLLSRMERQESADFQYQLIDQIRPIQQSVTEAIQIANKHQESFVRVSVKSHDALENAALDGQSNGEIDDGHFVANILIVDDSSDARIDLEEKTRRIGHRPFSCSSAEDALDMLSFRPFDVCLLDMHMPGVDGMEMIRRIRETARTSHLPIIVVSGSCNDSTGAHAIEMGANDFLTKPAIERLLQARVNACLRQTSARKAELAKFLPEAVIESVLLDDSVLHIPKVEDITVMVCDIRGFSKISETRNPVETIRWISDVMNRLSDIILAQGGTIVDYVGDEIMAMWGAPGGSLTHPEEACKCAVMIQNEVAKLSIEWYPKLMTPLQVGIGIHSGTAVCGNTGSKQRIKYGPLGNTVNLASRVQGATKYLHCSVLLTSDTANRVSALMRGRRICNIRVQNLSKPVDLYELVTESPEDYRKRVRPLNQFYERALESFERDEIQEALRRTAQILVDHPDDGPSKLLMLRTLQASLEQKYDPVWTMPGK